MKNSNILFKIPAKLVKDKNGTWTIYNKKYNISGYGKTKKEAREMFNFCVNDILTFKKP